MGKMTNPDVPGTPLTWDGAESKAVSAGDHLSDWAKANERSPLSIIAELLWSGDIDATVKVQARVGQVPFDLPIDLSAVEPDGHAYAGDLGAKVLELEALGHLAAELDGCPPFTYFRFKVSVSSGTGVLAGNYSINRGRTDGT